MRITLKELRKIIREEAENLEIGKNSSDVVAKGLKVKHDESGIIYTVVSSGPSNIVLRTPEGKQLMLNAAKFEKEFVVA